MKKLTSDDPETKSADLIAENITQLKALFPEAFTEGEVDFEVLKALLGGAVDEREEKFGLNWHGKRRARQLALMPSNGTLRPCPAESVDWETTKNIVIEGDNLEVLKLLQKSYAGKVKVIYIDPPYNTGNDFVYPDKYDDNLATYLRYTGQVNDEGFKISSNTEYSGRFHTNWLNMMYPRLKLARQLLSDEGAVFVSIDDGELSDLQAILNELFGEENFRANIAWQKRYTRSNNTVDFTTVVEHVLVYSKTEDFVVNLLERTKEADARYTNPDRDPRGPWKGASFLNPATPKQRPKLCYPIRNPNTGGVTHPTTNAWRRTPEEFKRLQDEGRLYWGADGTQPVPAIKMFLSEARDITPINFWEHGYAGNTDEGTRDLRDLLGEKVFDNPKPVQLLKRVLEHGGDPNSIVLDFFAGSGTTGHATLAQNAADGGHRRYLLVQLPEPLDHKNQDQQAAAAFCDKFQKRRSIAELTKERLRRAGKKIRDENPLFKGDTGFRVFKLDSSNIRAWDPDANNLAQSLLDSVQHLKSDRTEQDILFELLLKLGLELTVPIEARVIAGKTVYSVGVGSLLVCLATTLAEADVEPLALGIVAWHRELNTAGEVTLVFRDSAFADDIAKANLTAILQQNGLGTVRSL